MTHRPHTPFVKEKEFVWRTVIPMRYNTADFDMSILEKTYPNAKFKMQEVIPDSNYYIIFIEFSSGADEAEFILMELSND